MPRRALGLPPFFSFPFFFILTPFVFRRPMENGPRRPNNNHIVVVVHCFACGFHAELCSAFSSLLFSRRIFFWFLRFGPLYVRPSFATRFYLAIFPWSFFVLLSLAFGSSGSRPFCEEPSILLHLFGRDCLFLALLYLLQALGDKSRCSAISSPVT